MAPNAFDILIFSILHKETAADMAHMSAAAIFERHISKIRGIYTTVNQERNSLD